MKNAIKHPNNGQFKLAILKKQMHLAVSAVESEGEGVSAGKEGQGFGYFGGTRFFFAHTEFPEDAVAGGHHPERRTFGRRGDLNGFPDIPDAMLAVELFGETVCHIVAIVERLGHIAGGRIFLSSFCKRISSDVCPVERVNRPASQFRKFGSRYEDIRSERRREIPHDVWSVAET